ncbi:hypothetical protein BDN72DRAFT_761449 [Pluteus cervinus]|uniref:Uncharacterized protein n=1 Tax=Pluteus cervinus TaxID=181527 RepID=A0ACD3B7N7_9AGAR|nr:hypothetical protein BDN72DRAFT_761449 [Pluteus cervinus]
MDVTQSLDDLANVLTELSEKPLDIGLHVRHIHLAQSLEGDEAGLNGAREMMTDFLAADEAVWVPLIDSRHKSVDLDTLNGVEELLNLYERAEEDYLSIPLLQRHLQFLIDRHEHYVSEGTRPDDLGEVFTAGWTRNAIGEVVKKGLVHLAQSHLLWDSQRDWELEMLEAAPAAERAHLIEHIQLLHLARLKQPHLNSEDTGQSYSSFTTNYKAPQEYESLQISAKKLRVQGENAYNRREARESSLSQSSYSLEGYAQYIAVERRAKSPDLFVLTGVFERAIAEASKRRFNGEEGAEAALRSFWVGYADTLRINDAGGGVEFRVLRRAIRSVPGSGELWARYIRYLERVSLSEIPPENLPAVADVYTRAFGTKLLDSDIDQIVPVTLARAGYEHEDNVNEEAVGNLIGVLENGIDLVRKASKIGDTKLRLEKYLVDVYQNLVGLPQNAIEVWNAASKHSKSSYQVWILFTDLLIKLDQHDDARRIFVDTHGKNIDWPEAIWEAWIAFEHAHGSVEQIDFCLDKIENAQIQLNARRMKEAARAMQAAYEQAANSAPQAPVQVVEEQIPMDVDTTTERGTKRGAEDDPPKDHKKVKLEPKAPPLKRDRENSTVFVADLPHDATEEELRVLFKDCGSIREIKRTPLPNALVATVEFEGRDCVPAALTKDKKRIRGEVEVAVHLAWKSTLYVTNFPESADDASMRNLFGTYGTIFDIRWPSKKFKTTRRFCYVQFTSPAAAEAALELNGRELEPGHPMNVFLSNPERKKERTDQDANEREIYVAGLSKFTTQKDLENLFKTYGEVKEVRMTTDNSGKSKGFAFVEFTDEQTAQAALAANNYELKNRRIAVTLSDSRVKAKNRNAAPETGLGRQAEIRSRSIRIRNVPSGTQEGLLQQFFEKITRVKRLELFADLGEAVVELETSADAGKLLLRTEPLIFNGTTLSLAEEGSTAAPPTSGGHFVPRGAISKPRAGLGSRKQAKAGANSANPAKPFVAAGASSSARANAGGKGQDEFRKMLGGS